MNKTFFLARRSILGRLLFLGLFLCVLFDLPMKTFAISGLDPQIDEIRISGHRKLSESTIRKVIGINQGLIRDRYAKVELEKAFERLRVYYLERGYLDFEVIGHRIDGVGEGHSVIISISIFEGEIYLIGDIKISGLPDRGYQEILQNMEYQKGNPFDRRVFYRNEVKAVQYLMEHGYKDAQVATRYKTSGNSADIELVVNAGLRWNIKEIRVEGNKNVRSSLIRSEIRVAAGGIYNAKLIQESVNALYRTALFRSVRIKEEIVFQDIGSNKGILNLIFSIEESDYRSIGFGGGYDKYQEWFGIVRWETLNFLNRGSLFRSDLSVSRIKRELRFTYQERNFIFRDLLLETRPFWSEEKISEENLKQFSLNTVGVENTLLYPLNKYFRLTGGYDYHYYYNINTENTDTDSSTIAESLNFEILNENVYKMGLIFSTRNDILNPTRGVYSALIGKLNQKINQTQYSFWQLQFSIASYLPLWFGFILAPNISFGWMNTMKSGEQPLVFDRFSQGEDFNLRGYTFRQFGPQDSSGDFIGGDRFYFASVELRFPIFFYMQFVLFVDSGDLFLGKWEKQETAYTPGVGLRIQTPVGPIRLDVGFLPQSENWWDTANFSFGLGQSF